jgi:O-antigen/teichoic acid export membrane protein
VRARINTGAGKALLNTSLIWMRIVGIALAKLLTIRFLLDAFGAEGFGVFFAVSSIALLPAFLTGATQTMSLRAISLEAPRGTDMRGVFSNLFAIHVITAALMLALGGAFGYSLINNVMVIPSELLGDAHFIFLCIFSATVAGNIASLYEAFLQSKERFEIFAAIDVLRTWLLVPVSFFLTYQDGDLIKIYSATVAFLSILGFCVAAFMTVRRYPETRIRLPVMSDFEFMRHHGWIASWSLMGGISGVARTQGLVLLVNVLGGPTANAAYAIASQIPNFLRQFASTFQLVLAPRIYGREAVGDRNQMIGRVFTVCRLAVVFTLIAAIPIAVEMPNLLQLWLGDYEKLTATIGLLLLIALVVEQLAAGTGLAHLAWGRVARFNIIAGGLSILMLPTAYMVAQCTGQVLHILYTLLCFTGVVAVTKVLLLYPEVRDPIVTWISQTLIPMVCFTAPPLLMSCIVTAIFDPSVGRLLLTIVVSLLTSVPAVFFLVLTHSEREQLKSMLPLRYTPS